MSKFGHFQKFKITLKLFDFCYICYSEVIRNVKIYIWPNFYFLTFSNFEVRINLKIFKILKIQIAAKICNFCYNIYIAKLFEIFRSTNRNKLRLFPFIILKLLWKLCFRIKFSKNAFFAKTTNILLKGIYSKFVAIHVFYNHEKFEASTWISNVSMMIWSF